MFDDFLFPENPAEVIARLEEKKHFDHTANFRRGNAAPPPNPREAWLAAASAPKRSARRALYVHVPFCLHRCAFCSFFSNTTRAADLDAYTANVLKEMRDALAASPRLAEEEIGVVYFGGGTPTDLSAKNLAELISFIRTRFRIAEDVEFTVEGRTSGFDEEKIRACVEAGATRFSFGVQTFDTALRRRLGRLMSKEELIERLALVKEIGGERVSLMLDFIYGLPGQTPEIWAEDLDIVANRVPVDGADLYQLKLLPGTRLAAAGEDLSFDERFALFTHARERLASLGWRRLSMTHWARTPLERNLYNHGTKTGMEVLPFGSRAGGFLGGFSFMQIMDLKKYSETVASGEKGLMVAVPDNPGIRFKNAVTHQLELGFLEPATISPELDAPDARAVWENWVRADLLVPEAETARPRFTLTPLGEYHHTTLISLVLAMLRRVGDRLGHGSEAPRRRAPANNVPAAP
ncbi:MAG: radical SAM protein [Candidatus Spyradosoma sp.]